MADLSNLEAAQTVKIAGATVAGVETNFVDADSNGNIKAVVNNLSGANSVNIQDGGNSLTVDTPQLASTLGQKTMAESAAVVISSDQSTLPISAASLPLPAGASTSALQSTGNTSTSSIDTKTPPLGQALAGLSVPVVLTAAQITTLTPLTTVAVTGPLTDAQLRASAVPVSAASLPLPAGAATAALQTSGNSSLSSIDAGIPNALGSATTANSMPVNIASDQIVPISVASLPLPAGASTSALQTTLNTQIGATAEAAAATDTSTSGLNGLIKRVAQRLSSIFTALSDGTQQGRILGNSNNTLIGNSGDRLKVETTLPSDYSRSPFGSARVVTTQNVFESLFSFDKQPNIWDEELVTGATSTHNVNTNSIDMTTTTANGSSAIRQAFRRIRYNPSRTVQFLAAGIMGAGKTNVRKRVGQFDVQDGLFFEQDGTGIYVVRRTSTSGSSVDVRVAQSNWNIDKFDGTGPSGITIDFTRHQCFFFQYAFQGFGDITYGFYLNGQISFCHKETTGNVLLAPFIKTAHIPCRIEITNTAASASATTLSFNSFAIKNEGEDSETEGQIRSYSSGGLRTVGTVVAPVVSIRLGASFQKSIVDILSTNIFVSTVDTVYWSVWLTPTLTGSTFSITSGFCEIDTAATAMTGGTELISGILGQNESSASVSQDLLKLVDTLIGTSINGTSQIITIAARSRVGSAAVASTLIWREYP